MLIAVYVVGMTQSERNTLCREVRKIVALSLNVKIMNVLLFTIAASYLA